MSLKTQKNSHLLNAMHRDLTVSKILSLLVESSIPFCIWKNLHERTLMISGETDVDIHVPLGFKTAFERFCSDLGGIAVTSRIENYPGVVHIFFAGYAAKIIHLHVYYVLYTGESHIKDYMLPISNSLISRRVKDEDLGYIPSKEMENFINLIRYYLKRSSIIGLLLYWRENNDYIQQSQRINSIAGLPSEAGILGLDNLKFLLSCIHGGGIFQDYILGKWVRFHMHALRRFSALDASKAGSIVLLKHIWNRFILKEKKVLPVIGRFVAITGPDGAGKSTVLVGLMNKFKKKITVRQVHFGRPPPTFMTFFLHALLAIRRRYLAITVRRGRAPAVIPSNITILAALRYVALAYDRNRLAASVLRDLSKGYLVFSDRYPSMTVGRMDSPRIDIARANNKWIKYLSTIESRLYQNIAPVDLLIEFKVSEEIALNRNSMRIKDFKETDEEIINRLRDNKELSFRAGKHIFYHNDGTPEEAVDELFFRIWEILR